jgi:hypothetical protein
MSCFLDVFFQKSLTIEAVVNRMGCNKTINLVQCDTGPKLNFVLKDCDNSSFLTGVSGVKLFMTRSHSGCGSGEDCLISNEGHESLSGVDPSQGKWTYILQEGDVSGAGTYFGELTAYYDDGSCETSFQPIRIFVRESCKPCC